MKESDFKVHSYVGDGQEWRLDFNSMLLLFLFTPRVANKEYKELIHGKDVSEQAWSPLLPLVPSNAAGLGSLDGGRCPEGQMIITPLSIISWAYQHQK